jgi:hypothetical protein
LAAAAAANDCCAAESDAADGDSDGNEVGGSDMERGVAPPPEVVVDGYADKPRRADWKEDRLSFLAASDSLITGLTGMAGFCPTLPPLV